MNDLPTREPSPSPWAFHQSHTHTQRSIRFSALGVGLIIGLGVGCGTVAKTVLAQPSGQLVSQATPQPLKLTFVSYAVTKAAYDNIIPKFVEQWKKTHNNQEVIFEQSYGGSGSQARAVIDGLEADVVQLALALDIKKIEKAGLIEPGWQEWGPNNSIVTRSVVAIVTRQGNPKKIQTWADLVRPDVKFITANPKTSGGARWNFLALWGAVKETGGGENQANDFVAKAFKNVPVLPKDAREASDVFFKQGQGDALLNYENEVILAAQNGEKSSFFIVPPTNISIDAPVAVVDKNVDKHKTRDVAKAFVKFLFTPEAQREFAKVGFRPVDPTVAKEVAGKFPKVSKLYTVDSLGGWDTVQKKFFADGAFFDKMQLAQR